MAKFVWGHMALKIPFRRFLARAVAGGYVPQAQPGHEMGQLVPAHDQVPPRQMAVTIPMGVMAGQVRCSHGLQ